MNKLVQPNWSEVFTKSIEICNSDGVYNDYSVREKMLAFVFTFLQTLQEDETIYIDAIKGTKFLRFDTSNLNELKHLYVEYCDRLITEGTNSGEIQARPIISNSYQQILWNALLSILVFWSNDNSDHKENTDVMVEKTIHFSFDMLAPNAIDSGLDMLQHFFKLRNTNK